MDPYTTKALVLNQIGFISELFIQHIRSILYALALIIIGLMVSEILKWLAGIVLKALRWDLFCRRVAVESFLRKFWPSLSPTQFGAALVFWFAVLCFVMKAFIVSDLNLLAGWGRSFFELLPLAGQAGLIFLAAWLLAHGVGRGVAVSSDHPLVNLIVGIIQTGIMHLAAMLALMKLGLGAEMVVPMVLISMGAISLALALAWGLGRGNTIIPLSGLNKKRKGCNRMLVLKRDICNNFDAATRREWLETNGLGGYASGTVAGMHTRGYHSLLTVSLDPPLHCCLMLSQLEEQIIYQGQKYPLSTHQYRDAIAPYGYLNMEEFRLDPFPVMIYQVADLRLRKRIFMSYLQNLVWITYELLNPPSENTPVTLSIRPLVSFRDHHLRQRLRRFFSTHHDLDKKVIRLLPDQKLPALNLYHNAASFEHSTHWYHNLFYREERERGLDCEEDLFSPGVIHYALYDQAPTGFLAATIDDLEQPDPEAAARDEISRRQQLTGKINPEDDFGKMLTLAADQFIVKRGEGLSIMTGYPWLPDSGREAMAALPGLTLALGRMAEAESLLKTFAHYCSEGMLPNYFSEYDSKPFYNTADTALWFVLAVYHYRQAGGREEFIRQELWETLCQIVRHYQNGIRYNIRMDSDGLIDIPEEGAQLTWMDAQVGDWVATPRSGKTVEINSLWYNTVCIVGDLAQVFGEKGMQDELKTLAERIKTSFQTLFWFARGGYLYDRVENHYQDPSLRPNQILAVSLPFPLVQGEQAKKILETVSRNLLTPFGFRTLSPDQEGYKGAYAGDIIRREGAAYQGTVRPWLIGPYSDALKRVFGKSAGQQIRALLAPFKEQILEAGIGSIPEMFDGDAPHQPRGCISRAWGVAEILRLHLELMTPSA